MSPKPIFQPQHAILKENDSNFPRNGSAQFGRIIDKHSKTLNLMYNSHFRSTLIVLSTMSRRRKDLVYFDRGVDFVDKYSAC